MSNSLCFFVCALVIGLGLAAQAADDDLTQMFGSAAAPKPVAKPTVPADDAVKTASATLRSSFKDEFAKKDAKDKLAFSKSLREMAATESDHVQKYTLFIEASFLAVDAGSLDDALAAVSELCAACPLPITLCTGYV